MEKDESLRYSFHKAAFPSVQHQASIDLAWQVQMQKATDALVNNVRGQYKHHGSFYAMCGGKI